MTNLILFNKPYGVISQFSELHNKITLAKFIKLPKFYPAGRLDEDSEGLLLLTNQGALQNRIAHPKFKLAKTYWVQVEGEINDQAIQALQQGVPLKDGLTKPAKVEFLSGQPLPDRKPPIRHRANIPTSWIALTIGEGRNRQVRRMTAAVGFPTLRLYRYRIGSWTTDDIKVGKYETAQVALPK